MTASALTRHHSLPHGLEAQVGRAAVLLTWAQPEQASRQGRRDSGSWNAAPHSSSGVFELRCSLSRMQAVPGTPDRATGVRATQFFGEPAGIFTARLSLHATKPAWKNEGGAIPFDSGRPQWVALSDCRIEFGTHWVFHGFAMGQTWPLLEGGNVLLEIDAMGTLAGGREREGGLTGMLSVCGHLSTAGHFAGTVCCYLPDPHGAILREREIPALEARRDPGTGNTSFLIRATGPVDCVSGSDGSIRTTGVADIRAVDCDFTSRGYPGLRAATALGPSLGQVSIDITQRPDAGVPGTVTPGRIDAPSEFTASYDFLFRDERGAEVASLSARVLDGRMYALPSGKASSLRTAVTAGTGPVIKGGGHLAGARGLFSVLGTRSDSPSFLAENALVNLMDPEGRYRLHGAPRHPSYDHQSPLQRYLPMVDKSDEYAEKHRQWRWMVRQNSALVAQTIAAKYRELLHVGDFEAIPLDPAFMKQQFEAPIAPFNPVVFERYAGPAKGDFRFYSHATRQQTGGNVLYSYWNPATFRFGARYCKFITGSFQHYIRPSEVPDFSAHQFDPIVNSYRDDVGVVSYILVYQGKAPGLYQERTSFAYKMPGEHEVLWFVKDLVVDGKPAPPDVFMSSHEWKDTSTGQARYPMVGMFWRFDFDRGVVELADDMFWRALYIEEPAYI